MNPLPRFALYAAAFAAASLSGCAHRRPAPPPNPAFTELTAPVDTFDGAASILTGFDLGADPHDWQIGDRVLLGVRFRRPHNESTRFLLIELLDSTDPERITPLWATREHGRGIDLRSPNALTNMVLFDEHGKELEHATGRFPTELLGYGVFDGAAPLVGAGKPASQQMAIELLDDDRYDQAIRGWLMLSVFGGSAGRRTMLRPLLAEALGKPNALVSLPNPAITIGAAGPVHEAAPWTAAGPSGVPVLRVPLVCSIARRPAVVADALVARPLPPLTLCGGLIGVSGHNVDDPRIAFDIRLLAAARGTGGRAFHRSASPER